MHEIVVVIVLHFVVVAVLVVGVIVEVDVEVLVETVVVIVPVVHWPRTRKTYNQPSPPKAHERSPARIDLLVAVCCGIVVVVVVVVGTVSVVVTVDTAVVTVAVASTKNCETIGLCVNRTVVASPASLEKDNWTTDDVARSFHR